MRRGGARRPVGALLVALIFLAPLAIGTVHAATRTLVFALCALALALTLVERRRAGKRLAIGMPLVALLVAVGATAVQLVPLPAGLVAFLSPAAHDGFGASLGDYGAHALSLDPTGSWRELAKLAAYAAFLAAATSYASQPQRRRHIVMAVAGAATLVALVGFAQALAGARTVLFYAPQSEVANEIWVRGTFVNPNHFGAFMGLGAACALALGLYERRLRLPAALALIVLNVAAVLSLSRAALVCTPLAQALTFGLDRWQLRGGGRTRGGVLALAVVAGLGMAAAIGAGRLGGAAATSAEAKLETWRTATQVAARFPWTGVGRGAFEQAFTQVSEHGGELRVQWAENAYLQALADWGGPVGLLLLVLAGWSAVMAVRRLEADPLTCGALGGLVALAVHEAADFSVELPGVALPALALLGVVFARRGNASDGRLVPARAWLLAAPAVVLALALRALPLASADEDGRALARAVANRGLATARVRALGAELRARHPADSFIPLLVAERLARDGEADAITWLNQALYLNPSHPSAHQMAAELLARAGHKSQALLEYRLAASGSPEPEKVFARAAARYPALDDLSAVAPVEGDRLRLLAVWLDGQGRRDDARQAFARVVEAEPGNVAALQARAALAPAGDAQARVRELLAVDSSQASTRVAARALLGAGDLEGAARLLDGLDRSAAGFELDLDLARALAASGHLERARARLERLGWVTDRGARARLHRARGELEAQAGNQNQAKLELEEAARLERRE